MAGMVTIRAEVRGAKNVLLAWLVADVLEFMGGGQVYRLEYTYGQDIILGCVRLAVGRICAYCIQRQKPTCAE